MDTTEPGALSISRRVAKGAGWVMAWRMVSRNLGLLSTLVLVRLLKPEDFGLVTLAAGFASTVDSLSEIGVQDALVREASPGRDIYDTAFGLNLARGVITALIMVAIAWPAADFFAEPRMVAIMLTLGASSLMSGFFNMGFLEFRRELKFDREFRMQVVSRTVMVLSTVSAALIWHSYWALIFGLVMNRLASVVQSYTMCAFRPRISFRSWRRLFGFSFWTWMQTMVFQIRDRGDSVIITRILGTAPFGTFSIGAELGSLPVTEVVEPLGRSLFSGFALLRRDDSSPTRLYLGAVEAAITLVLPAGIGISMVADPMVRFVLGERWLAAVPVIQIIAVASTVSIFGYFSGTFLTAGGKVRETFLLNALSLSLRIPVMIVLAHEWGLSGAAIAVAVGLLADQGLYLWRTMRQLSITPGDLLGCIWRAMVASAAMVACLRALGMAWTVGGDRPGWSNFEDLLARCVIGAAVYGMALLVAWYLAGRPDSIERQVFMLLGKHIRWRRARP